MPYSHYERLSAIDATFLEIEDGCAHMHIGAVALFDAAPLQRSDGHLDIDRIAELMESQLHRLPRYRQRLAWIPVSNHPVWVDDDRFNLHYHLRHTSLPPPGDERLLKRLTGRLMSQQLDRGKPLWEMWVIEGVEGNRFAIISKSHHCMIDGVGSVELMGSVLRQSAEPRQGQQKPAPRWVPRPVPTPRELLRGELERRAREPLALMRGAGRALANPRAAIERLRRTTAGLGEAIGAGMHSASPTPLNAEIGPHRRFDWTELEFPEIKEIRKRLGGTLNDVVLAIFSGALRHFLGGRGLPIDSLDFRAMIPVNVRSEGEQKDLGNLITMVVAHLPLEERDPQRRLQQVIETTRELKGSRQGLGVKTLEDLSDWTLTSLFVEFARLAIRFRPYNVVVTNIPGPAFPIYLLEAPMLAIYPLVPLYRNQGLGVALFSYNGKLYWGFNSDWDAVPDLHDLVEAVNLEAEKLRKAAAHA